MICVLMLIGCNRHPPTARSAIDQAAQLKSTAPTGPEPVNPDSLPVAKPLPIDSTLIARLLKLIPSIAWSGMYQADECRIYQITLRDRFYIYPRYAVRYTELGDLESKISIYSNFTKADSVLFLALANSRPIFVIDGSAEYFYGMRDSLLFTDVGTSGGERGVWIYNVLRQDNVFRGSYVASFWLSSFDTLAYWEIVNGHPDSTAFPDANKVLAEGNTPVIVEVVKVHLGTFAKVYTGQRKSSVLD
jgi:hypothetical protein